MKLHQNNIDLFTTLCILIFFMAFIISCKKNSGDNITNFTIKIDSISHPDTIFIDSTLIIQFHGNIGSTECYSFYKFEPSYTKDSLHITSLGQFESKQGCALKNINLESKTLLISNLPKGNTNIIITQPDSTTLIDSVYVR